NLRKHFFADHLDAEERILLADFSVVAPQREDAWPGLLQDSAQLRHHGLRRAGDDAQVRHLLLEAGDTARVGSAAGGKFDKGTAVGRRAVARRRAPDRVRQAGELALHPAKFLGVRDRLLLAVGYVHLDQVAAVLRPGGVARFLGDLVVELPD